MSRNPERVSEEISHCDKKTLLANLKLTVSYVFKVLMQKFDTKELKDCNLIKVIQHFYSYQMIPIKQSYHCIITDLIYEEFNI